MEPTGYLDSLRPAGSKRSSKRDLIVNVFLRQQGHLTADDLFDLIRREDIARISGSENPSATTTPAATHAHQPGDGLPHVAVDGGRRDRAEGRFRRRPVPV